MSCRVSLQRKESSRFKNSPSASLRPHPSPHLPLFLCSPFSFLPAFAFRVSLALSLPALPPPTGDSDLEQCGGGGGGQKHCYEQLVPNAFLPDSCFRLFFPQ